MRIHALYLFLSSLSIVHQISACDEDHDHNDLTKRATFLGYPGVITAPIVPLVWGDVSAYLDGSARNDVNTYCFSLISFTQPIVMAGYSVIKSSRRRNQIIRTSLLSVLSFLTYMLIVETLGLSLPS